MTNLKKAWFSNKIVFTWALSILASLIILAVGGAYYASLNKAQSAQPAQKTTISLSGYRVQPDDLRPYVRSSFLVVEGIVKKVKPAVWTTPNGLAPSNIAEAMQNMDIQTDVQLRTPILISITRTIKGNKDTNISGDLLFTVAGGESGDYIIKVADDDPALVTGDRIVVFLNKAPKNAGPWAKISPYFPEIYFIVRGDTLVGFQKTMQRSELESQFQAMQDTK